MLTSFQVVAPGHRHWQRSDERLWQGRLLVVDRSSSPSWPSLHVARIMLDLFLVQRFMLAWRAWLTDRLTGDWLDGKAYYRARFIDDTIDNPDQRIQTDIDIFTAGNGPLPNTPNMTTSSTLLFGAIDAIASMISFTAILWNLSGTLTLPIVGFELPRAMFWIGLVYVLFATVIAFWIGRPIIWLSLQQREVQRRVPLRAGATARCVGGGRLLPRRARRAHGAAATFRARRLQLQAVPEPDDRVLRLEPLDEPDHRAAAVSAAVPAVLRRRDHTRRHDPDRIGVRQHPGRAVVLPQRLRPVRRLPRRDHPPARPGGRQRRGQGAAGADHHAHASTARSSSTMSRSARPTGSSSSSRSTCAWKSATRW